MSVNNKDKKNIQKVIDDLGVKPNQSGYFYIVDGVSAALETIREGKACKQVMNMYIDIAKKHGTTSTRVERDIRYSIEVVHKNANNLYEGLFPNEEKKPKNSAFLSRLALYVDQLEDL